MYWDGPDLVIENYVSGQQVSVHPAICQLLHGIKDFTDREDIMGRFDAVIGKSPEVMRELVSADVLIEENSRLDERDRKIDDTWSWGQNARYFHFSTQRVDYTFDHNIVRRNLERKALHNPPPSPFKEIRGPKIPLPGSFSDRFDGVWAALSARRTCRAFERRALSLLDLSNVLRWTWGMTRYYNGSQLDRRILKTSPSGGARHPIEVYVVAQRVEGLAAGLYHYAVQHDALSLMRSGQFEKKLVNFYSGQTWVKDAAALFIMTAVLPRSMWKYDHARAYRVVLMDAGHLGQTFHLVVTALGLGAFTTAALQDESIQDFLGIDGVTETVVYGCAAGFRRQ